MKSVLVFFLKLFALLVLALVGWSIALYMEWPWWAGAMIFFGVIAVYLTYRLTKRLWVTVRSRVKLAQSELAARRSLNAGPLQTDLTAKWKVAIERLRKSSLKRFGNPLYVLPWYMVVGESGSGKTTAITRSRLTSVIKNVSQSAPILQTVDFEWWFFSKAIVIDTAGRYVSPTSLESDQDEWEKMLELLARYRSREGLDGLVVVIEADRLLENDSEKLEQRGRVLRERIDQLIRLFDKRFPIYVLITKCDLISGFHAWSETLPQDQIEQAMGYMGESRQGDGAEDEFLKVAFAKVGERLKQLRLDMAVKGVELTTDVLMFPSEIERLQPGLHSFVSACLGNTPYLEQPLFRGLFFSSGRQTGHAMPGLLTELLRPAPVRPVSETGFFLHDFFGNILPKDRGVFLPTKIVNRWHQVTRNLALISWLAILLAAGTFLFVSYAATKNSLRQIEAAFPTEIGDGSQDILQARQRLAALHSVVELILEQERKWETKWLAFSPEIDQLEDDLKAAFVAGMKEFFGRNSAYGVRMRELLAKRDSPLYPELILGITRYYNKSQAGLQGASYDEIIKMPAVPTKALQALDSVLTPEVIAGYHRMVSAFFAWSANHDPQVMHHAQEDLALLSSAVFSPGQLGWLLTWVDDLGEIPSVSLNEFWMPGSVNSLGTQVRPAFTRAGELKIQGFLNELSLAFNHSPEFTAKRTLFEGWYRAERVNAWHTFASSFGDGDQLLVSEPIWREMIGRVNKINSPYYRLIRRLSNEFDDLPQAQLPGWLLFARDFSRFRLDAQNSGVLSQAETVAGLFNTIGGRALQDSVQNRSIKEVPSQMSQALSTIEAYRQFITDFDIAAAAAIEGEGKAYQMSADFFSFGIDPSTKTSTLRALQDTFSEFKKRSGFSQPDDAVLWPLVGGPLQLLIRYVNEQASCSVQKEWDKSVLWRTQTAVSAKEVGEQLYGQQGSVWAFASASVKPFIEQKGSEFSAVKAPGVIQTTGYTFPFKSDFLPFLNRSVGSRVSQLVKDQRAENAKGKSVKLAIASRPIGVNASAKVKPFAAILSVQCANEEIVLNNFNVQSSDTVTWSPDLCGDASLQIKIESMTLTRRYPGALGLARFIQEFEDGERIFTPEDFPSQKEKLDAQDVRTINVRYDFVGQETLLKLAEDYSHLAEVSMPTTTAGASGRRQFNIPERVGQCWSQGRQTTDPLDVARVIEQRVTQTVLGPTSVPSAPVAQPEPAPATAPATVAEPGTVTGQRSHRVESGDTLSKLALKYKTTIQAIQKLNGLNGSSIRLGETLIIPAK